MSHVPIPEAPYGYDVWTHTEVVPKPPPVVLRWRIGPIGPKTYIPVPLIRRGSTQTPATGNEEITVQLTADQQVDLSVGAEDRYGNPVDISGANAVWTSSDETIIQVNVDSNDKTQCTAVAVGPVGTASVTVANEAATVQGSLAIDVVAGQVAEIVINPGTVSDKPT